MTSVKEYDTAGEEYGVEIGLINYPRFPASKETITDKARELGKLCRDASFQNSYLVMTPEKTYYHSNRETPSTNK